MSNERPLKKQPEEVPSRVAVPVKAGRPEKEITKKPEETTAEEQMARFEDALKEEDWGHQPC